MQGLHRARQLPLALQAMSRRALGPYSSECTHTVRTKRRAQPLGHAQCHDGRRLVGTAVSAACTEGSHRQHTACKPAAWLVDK